MENKDYLEDLKEIKNMMSKSSTFLSLSGLSGVLAGCYALIGALVAHLLIRDNDYIYIKLESKTFQFLLIDALCILVASTITGIVLSYYKAKKNNENLWNATSIRLLTNFMVPLITGALLIILLLNEQVYGLVAPLSLIFYGLACFNASKYTFRDVRFLGITQIILGLIAVKFSGFGLYFWVLGFGLCHIFYGAMMWFKYERK